MANSDTSRSNERRNAHATPAGSDVSGYTIDVRVFLAIITMTMAISFAVGVMIGPTDPALVQPALSLLGIPSAARLVMNELDKNHGGSLSLNRVKGEFGSADHLSPAGKLPEGILPSNTGASSSSKKAPSRMSAYTAEVSVDGETLVDDHGQEEEMIIRQPKRTPTSHIATLGYKIRETHVNIDTPVLEDLGQASDERQISVNDTHVDNFRDGEEDDTVYRDQHMPSGQHLLVDIKNVDAAFLNSESQLAEAMAATVDAGGLTLLSYHCHTLHPAGVSCVGVLLESHISFHTWPDEGVITLDLFTCGKNPLLPVLPKIEELFGIPRVDPVTGEKEEIATLWSHELRGFRTEDERRKHYLDDESDLAFWVTSPIDVVYKKQIVSVKTDFQQIDIWDTKEREDTPSYEDGVKLGLKAGDPRWFSYKDTTPARMLFLDGVLQSISDSEREYHEALVHPAMFAHPSPNSVAIIGGGEGATLREVLRHQTVRKATMIEIDEMMVKVAIEHLPHMSDCSDIEGSAPSCFDDERAEVVFANAFDYFMDKFGSDEKEESDGLYDVLIVDALDPEENDEIAGSLYNDETFVSSLIDSLTEDGVLVMQVGTAPSINDPRADMGIYQLREFFINRLEANPKITSIFIYEEAHCGFLEPHSFLIACRDVSCRKHWYAETDEVDYQIYERIGGTVSGKPSLIHFDGATQRSFQMPPRAWETVYCRREPEPYECDYRGLDMSKQLFEYFPDDDNASAFVISGVEDESTGENGTVVHAKVDIPEGSYIMPTHLAASFEISDDSIENLRNNTMIEGTGSVAVIEDFIEHLDTHGHPSLQEGSGKNYVEVGGSFLMRTSDDQEEVNVRRWVPVPPEGRPKYSPVFDRHRHSFDVFLVASRDIKAGDEVVKPVDLWD